MAHLGGRAFNTPRKNRQRLTKSTRGDLVEMGRKGQFDVILHGCNCWCEMGAGIAKAIRQNFPEAYRADLETTPGDPDKLGTCSVGSSPVEGGEVDVVNASIQFNYSRKRDDEVLVDYEAVRSCMRWIKERYSGRRIGLPKIGAGLAGGDWNSISRIIDEELDGEDVTLVEL